MRNFKIILVSLFFYAVGCLITYGLLRLWGRLFSLNFWKITFSLITLLGAMKYFWEHTEWIIKQFKKS